MLVSGDFGVYDRGGSHGGERRRTRRKQKKGKQKGRSGFNTNNKNIYTRKFLTCFALMSR